MLVGSSVHPNPGETWPAAWTRINRAFGPLQAARIYATSCPGPEDEKIRAVVAAGAVPLISFRTWDAAGLVNFRRLAANLDRATVTFNHEPEDNPISTAAIAAVYAAMRSAVDAAGKRGKVELWHVLMGWTVNPHSGLHPDDYLTAPLVAALDGIGWDAYAGQQGQRTPADLYGPCAAESARWNRPWAVFETGSQINASNDATLAAWYASAIAYARPHGARYFSLWNSIAGDADFRIDALPRTAAVWHAAATRKRRSG